MVAPDAVGAHGVRVDVRPFGPLREHWVALGVPAEVIDRMAAFHRRRGQAVRTRPARADGEASCLDHPPSRAAIRYSGIR